MSGYKVLIDTPELDARVRSLGAELVERFQTIEEPILVIGVLRGSVLFMADLVRAMDRPLETEYVRASSYGDARVSSGKVTLSDDRPDVRGRHVLLVEDIVDTGLTLAALTKALRGAGLASLTTVSLLDKPSRREVDVEADLVAFTIEDAYVIGYGLDDAGLFRNLPFVAVVDGD
ncbi:MAG: hypoxanthine phosphoribosyltransferase [Myxococcales bacterium]|nr:hypoxanthine phosphoribosyltransferase [Myxococcales bacterium]